MVLTAVISGALTPDMRIGQKQETKKGVCGPDKEEKEVDEMEGSSTQDLCPQLNDFGIN